MKCLPLLRNLVGVLFVGVLLCSQSARAADLKAATIFGDHMVLQQGMNVPIWGFAAPGEKVTVSFAGQSHNATTDANGRWSVTLSPLKATDAGDVTIQGKTTVTIKDVLVGEVWVCSGQSNMELRLAFQTDLKNEMKTADLPKLRLFHQARAGAAEPLTDSAGSWMPCDPKNKALEDFSAVGYFFGKDLHQALNVPVGIVESSWGGSSIEAWISKPALAADVDGDLFTSRWDQAVSHYPDMLAKYKIDQAKYDGDLAKYKLELAAYQESLKQAKAAPQDATKPATSKPSQPTMPYSPTHADDLDNPQDSAFMVDQTVMHYPVPHPSGLYNGMTAPLVSLAIRGVAWYQGESNFDRPKQYLRLLPLMMSDWRKAWGRDDLPFLIVQLPNVGHKQIPEKLGLDGYAMVREAQLATVKADPHSALIVTMDNTDVDLHPKDKRPVGERLLNAAQVIAYGKNQPYVGPRYDSMKIDGGKIRLTLKDDGGGLKAGDGGAVEGFVIAGADHKWFAAKAVIDGNDIIVQSDQVAAPQAARYAWDPYPQCNLKDVAGLIASPFRTDDWPNPGEDRK